MHFIRFIIKKKICTLKQNWLCSSSSQILAMASASSAACTINFHDTCHCDTKDTSLQVAVRRGKSS